MSDRTAELASALDTVVDAARAHLAAVQAAQGRIDDDGVWQAYVALNNASFAYDELLLDVHGEVTPWDVEAIDADEAGGAFGEVAVGDGSADAHPRVVSVRQRRDYRVPSVAALLRAAGQTRRAGVSDGAPVDEVESVGEAVLELLQSGDGSLTSLDVPQLEPLDGVVTVSEVGAPLDVAAFAEEDAVGPFTPGPDDVLVGRLDEHPVPGDDEHGERRQAP